MNTRPISPPVQVDLGLADRPQVTASRSKGKTVLALYAEAEGIFDVANLLLNVAACSARLFGKLALYHDGLKEKDMAALRSLCPWEVSDIDMRAGRRTGASHARAAFTLAFADPGLCPVLWLVPPLLVQSDLGPVLGSCPAGFTVIEAKKKGPSPPVFAFYKPGPGARPLHDRRAHRLPQSCWSGSRADLRSRCAGGPAFVPIVIPEGGRFCDTPALWLGYPQWRRAHEIWTGAVRPHTLAGSDPEISVIMPTFNAARYLSAALESLQGQTFADWELLIIDGGSRDDTLAIVSRFADVRIRVLPQPSSRPGIAAALNWGISQARGNYIARMDADDIALPDRLRRQRNFLRDSAHSMCFCSVQVFQDRYAQVPAVTDKGRFRAALFFATPIFHPSVMWKREDFEKHALGYDETFLGDEDFELWQRADKLVSIRGLSQCLLLYRQHGGQSNISEHTDRFKMRLAERSFADYGVTLSEQGKVLAAHRNASGLLGAAESKKAAREYFAALLRIVKTMPPDSRPFFYREILASYLRIRAAGHAFPNLLGLKVLFFALAGGGVFGKDLLALLAAGVRKLPLIGRLASLGASGGLKQDCLRRLAMDQAAVLALPGKR